MKKKIILLIGLVAMLFTGCGLKVQEYNPSADNVVKLRNLKNTKISVGKFTAVKPNETQVLCRLAKTIATPTGESFEKYIEEALKSELKMADKYNENSDIKISGKLLNIYGSSMLGDAYWEMEVEVISSNGKKVTVKTRREYPSSLGAYTACSNMSTSFAPTVKKLINAIISHKDFNTLLH